MKLPKKAFSAALSIAVLVGVLIWLWLSPDTGVRVEAAWLRDPMILPGPIAEVQPAAFRSILEVISRTRTANSWEEYASCFTPKSADALSFSSPNHIELRGKEGWEATQPLREKYKQRSVLGAILMSSGEHRYAFVYQIAAPVTRVAPGQRWIELVVLVHSPTHGWQIDEAKLRSVGLVAYLMQDLPLEIICFGKKADFEKVIPDLKDYFRREFVNSQEGFYHSRTPSSPGWIEWKSAPNNRVSS